MYLNLASVLQFLTWKSKKQLVFSSKDYSVTEWSLTEKQQKVMISEYGGGANREGTKSYGVLVLDAQALVREMLDFSINMPGHWQKHHESFARMTVQLIHNVCFLRAT